MTRTPAAIVIFAALAGPALAGGVEIAVGETRSSPTAFPIAVVAVTNATGGAVSRAEIGCGFLVDGRVVATAEGSARNIADGATAYETLMAGLAAGVTFDAVECRVVSVR